MNKVDNLTEHEKGIIRGLNYTATYDGFITSEQNIVYLLKEGIKKFIPKRRQHLLSVDEDAYPIQIIMKC